MYTEDDEKVTVKKNNSNIEYSDFYTSFNEIDNEETSSKKKKQKEEIEVKKEIDDTLDFYDNNNDDKEDFTNDNKGKYIKIIVVVLLVVLVLLMIILFISKGKEKKVSGDIELVDSNIVLNLGETKYISYKIIDTDSEVIPTFTSSDLSVVTVSESGEVTAIGEGEAVVTINYTIDGVRKEKKCNIKIELGADVNRNVELSLSFKNGANDTWINKDAIINVEAKSIFGISEVKYAINCDSNCNYNSISNNTITISNEGVTKVKVVARDKKNQEITKEVIIKIDKSLPTVKLNSDKNITSNKEVTVCATCTDSLSGCKQSQVCKKYSSSKSNQTITVEDKAGNKKTTESFNVTINKLKAPCSLKVSQDGVVTATLREEAVYYGFNSSYTGSNELSKKVDINASRKDETKAQLIYYYVKNKNGTGGKCFITVIKTCSCQDKNSTDSNCPVSCKFTSQ